MPDEYVLRRELLERYDPEQSRIHSDPIFLLQHGELTNDERAFLAFCWKHKGKLGPLALNELIRIERKYLMSFKRWQREYNGNRSGQKGRDSAGKA